MLVLPTLTCLIAFGAPEPGADAPGQRVDLGGATLFVPEGYRPEGGRVDLVLHLHGATSVVEPALAQSGWKAVLVTFNRKGLSRVYAEPFSDPALFPGLLEKALAAIRELGLADEPKLGRVLVSSFSAGFGGVRAILRVPAQFDRVDAILMADSIYSGYTGDPARREVDPDLMDGFARFAEQAAAGRKALYVTHSEQVPDGYASTTETADYLLKRVAGEPTVVREDLGEGLILTRSFRTGRLLVDGFEGAGPEDHMRHLRRIGTLWARMPQPFEPGR